MADIRIKDLAVTASASSSDDYLAVDGSTNGTRKLNAYSPSFGGNATVGGTLTVSGSGGVILNATDAIFKTTDSVSKRPTVLAGVTESAGTYTAQSTTPVLAKAAGDVGVYVIYADSGKTAGASYTPTSQLTVSSTATTLAGNLTVSGTGTSSVAGKVEVNAAAVTTSTNNPSLLSLLTTDSQAANKGGGIYFGGVYSGTTQTNLAYIGGVKENSTDGNYAGKLVFGTRANGTGADDMTRMTLTSGGNLLLGTTTDNSLGRLQVNGAITGYNTTASSATLYLTSTQTSTGITLKSLVGVSSERSWAITTNTTSYGDFQIRVGNAQTSDPITAGTAALTLDSSQNATFAGTVAGSVASGGTTSVYGKATLASSSADNAIVWHGIGDQNSANRAGLVCYQSWNGTYTDYLAKITITQGGVGGLDNIKFLRSGGINLPNLPTSASGLSAGDIWNDSGTLKIV